MFAEGQSPFNSHPVSISSPSKPVGYGWSIHRGGKMNWRFLPVLYKLFVFVRAPVSIICLLCLSLGVEVWCRPYLHNGKRGKSRYVATYASDSVKQLEK